MNRLLFVFAALAGCAHEPINDSPRPTPSQPGVAFAEPPPTTPNTPTTTPPKATTRVELTAVTLADDCGGTPPWSAPARTAKSEAGPKSEPKAKAKRDSADDDHSFAKGARAKRRCEQTSMQLSIIAGDASSIQVKSVELFDEFGKSLGTLTASSPTRWSDASGRYEAWDEKTAAGATSSVSYVLSQPRWDQIGDRWNRTYTLKAVLSVGGVDQATQKDVTLSAPTSLPPNVKT